MAPPSARSARRTVRCVVRRGRRVRWRGGRRQSTASVARDGTPRHLQGRHDRLRERLLKALRGPMPRSSGARIPRGLDIHASGGAWRFSQGIGIRGHGPDGRRRAFPPVEVSQASSAAGAEASMGARVALGTAFPQLSRERQTVKLAKSCQALFSRGIVSAKSLMVRSQTPNRKSRFEKMVVFFIGENT